MHVQRLWVRSVLCWIQGTANRPTELEQNEWGCIDKDGARVHQVQISQGFVSHGAAGLVPPWNAEPLESLQRGDFTCFYLQKIVLASVLRIQRWEERQRRGTTGLTKANEGQTKVITVKMVNGQSIWFEGGTNRAYTRSNIWCEKGRNTFDASVLDLI